MLKKDLEDKMNEFVQEIADFIFTRSQENLVKPMKFESTTRPKPRKPSIITDTGTLLKLGRIEHERLNPYIVYDVPYADFIEYGTPPHMPPVAPLIKWARKKLKTRGNPEKIGWGIAITIKKFGTDPHPFLRPAIEEAKQKYGNI